MTVYYSKMAKVGSVLPIPLSSSQFLNLTGAHIDYHLSFPQRVPAEAEPVSMETVTREEKRSFISYPDIS